MTQTGISAWVQKDGKMDVRRLEVRKESHRMKRQQVIIADFIDKVKSDAQYTFATLRGSQNVTPLQGAMALKLQGLSTDFGIIANFNENICADLINYEHTGCTAKDLAELQSDIARRAMDFTHIAHEISEHALIEKAIEIDFALTSDAHTRDENPEPLPRFDFSHVIAFLKAQQTLLLCYSELALDIEATWPDELNVHPHFRLVWKSKNDLFEDRKKAFILNAKEQIAFFRKITEKDMSPKELVEIGGKVRRGVLTNYSQALNLGVSLVHCTRDIAVASQLAQVS